MAVQNLSFFFLREFTKELITNSLPEDEFKSRVMPDITFKTPIIEERAAVSFSMPKAVFKPQIQPKPVASAPQGFPRITNPIVSESELALEKSPENFELGKLNALLKDPRINQIECTGAGKSILVKSMGKLSITNISLSMKEIKKIIDGFSLASKIPVVRGLFKAAVGNLVITAVISEIAGPRFIITRVTPFNPYWTR